MTRVSVCMATFNGAAYLFEQLDSTLVQLQSEDELIISDDHSTDQTQVIHGGYRDARIKIFTNIGKRGHVQTFAYAMAQATGEFIALSDQDDIWAVNRLERMLEQLCSTNVFLSMVPTVPVSTAIFLIMEEKRQWIVFISIYVVILLGHFTTGRVIWMLLLCGWMILSLLCASSHSVKKLAGGRRPRLS
jgi:glycosyltransferase involved in cell wall biosynthesis